MVKFGTLWDNHPNNGGDEAPCRTAGGKAAFENQCAIRMGVCLHSSGVDLRDFRGARCWHGHQPGHILRAQELANWLRQHHRRFGHFRVFANYQAALPEMRGRQGIVFYQNFWGTGQQGDHIDLWDRYYATREFSSFFGALPFASTRSPYNKAQEVWFWRCSS